MILATMEVLMARGRRRMENSSSADEIMRKRIVVIVAGVVALTVVAVVVWVVSMIPWHNGEVKTINQDDVVESGVLTERNLVAIEDTVTRKIEAFYSDKISGGATISVRTDSVKKDGKIATVLADVEELRITYEVTLDTETNTATSNCAALEDTKYLDGFCASGETSTISVAFGEKLPRTGSFIEGKDGEIVDGFSSDSSNASGERKYWRLSASDASEEENPDGSKRPYFVLETYYCDEDEKFIQSAKNWLDSLETGVSAEIFQYKVNCGVEDLKLKQSNNSPHG